MNKKLVSVLVSASTSFSSLLCGREILGQKFNSNTGGSYLVKMNRGGSKFDGTCSNKKKIKNFASDSISRRVPRRGLVSLASSVNDKSFLGKKRFRDEDASESLIPGIPNKLAGGVGVTILGTTVLGLGGYALNKKFGIARKISNPLKRWKIISFIKKFDFVTYKFGNKNYGFWERDLGNNKILCVWHCCVVNNLDKNVLVHVNGSFTINKNSRGQVLQYLDKIASKVDEYLCESHQSFVNFTKEKCRCINTYKGYHVGLPSSSFGRHLIELFAKSLVDAGIDERVVAPLYDNKEERSREVARITEASASDISDKFNKILKNGDVDVLIGVAKHSLGC